MKNILALIFSCSIVSQVAAQKSAVSSNVVIVTTDGLRWQEVFSGADSLLTFDTAASYSTREVEKHFWAASAEERRKKLMPFFWSEIVNKGTILGNRHFENFFENANPYWFSYPGYNEIFTGFADTSVNSNDKIPNKNESVLESLNKLPEFRDRVAIFGSWDVYASIFNEQRSGLLVNDGFRDLKGKLTEKQKLFNALQHDMPAIFHGSERLDVATFNIGFEYMKQNKPKVIYFGFGDTDEFAHAGMYDHYLDAAMHVDGWIAQLWKYIQSTPQYANKTTLIITTDHGRGEAAEGNWKHHGSKIKGANQMWMAAIGPAITASGEVKTQAKMYQGQIAATIAAALRKEFKPAHKPLPAIEFSKK